MKVCRELAHSGPGRGRLWGHGSGIHTTAPGPPRAAGDKGGRGRTRRGRAETRRQRPRPPRQPPAAAGPGAEDEVSGAGGASLPHTPSRAGCPQRASSLCARSEGAHRSPPCQGQRFARPWSHCAAVASGGINGASREKNGGESHWVGDTLQCPSSPFRSLQPSLRGGGDGSGMRLSPSPSSPKKGRLGPRAAAGTLGSRGRGVSPGCSPSCTTSAMGEKPVDNKDAVGAGLGCPPPSPPDTPICGAPLGVRGQELALVDMSASIRPLCWDLVCDLACPTGAKGTSSEGRWRETEGYWACGLLGSVP